MKNKKIIYFVNVDWLFLSHRLPIALEAQKQGYKVYVLSRDTGKSSDITKHGITFLPINIHRSSANPLKELWVLFRILLVYVRIKPDIVHHITIKPIIYGSLIARLLKINVVNAVSGLGYVFTDGRTSKLQKILVFLMRFGFNSNQVSVIFQNKEDAIELKSRTVLTQKNKIYFIKGVGVDLNFFKPNIKSEVVNTSFKILFAARMLKDKGLCELITAARILKPSFKDQIQFVLCGMVDLDNPEGVSEALLQSYLDTDYIVWQGHQSNIKEYYEKSSLVVLPSYREGMPKSLIEACAMGLPIVTTDAIGCKDCVDHGVNGIKVPVKDSDALANAISQIVVNKKLQVQMGQASREKALREFDVVTVVNNHMKIYENLFLLKTNKC